jgi:hypothetical protein
VCACIEPNRPTARHDDAPRPSDTTFACGKERAEGRRRPRTPLRYFSTFRHTARTQRRTGHPNVMSACKQVVRPSVWPAGRSIRHAHNSESN